MEGRTFQTTFGSVGKVRACGGGGGGCASHGFERSLGGGLEVVRGTVAGLHDFGTNVLPMDVMKFMTGIGETGCVAKKRKRAREEEKSRFKKCTFCIVSNVTSIHIREKQMHFFTVYIFVLFVQKVISSSVYIQDDIISHGKGIRRITR